MNAATEWLEWDERRAREWLAVPRAGDDKYSRGVLGVITGSHDYPGAAVLGLLSGEVRPEMVALLDRVKAAGYKVA